MRQMLFELTDSAHVADQLHSLRDEWDTGAYRSLLIRVLSGRGEQEWTVGVFRQLREAFPQACITGTMSAGEIKSGHLMRTGVLVCALLFQTSEVWVRRYRHVRGNEQAVGRHIREELDATPGVKAAELLFPGTELNTKSMFEELSQCDPRIHIFGGYSGGHSLNDTQHFIFDDAHSMFDSVWVTCFAGDDLHVNIDKLIGWEPLGLPFRVTKASGNRLIELDGRPASEIYEKFLQIDRTQTDNAEEGYTFPFMAERDGEAWLRSAIHIEEDGSLDLHGFVMEGMSIQLSYGNTDSIVKQVNERLDAVRAFEPDVVLLYSCIVRKAFWEDFVDIEMEPFEALASTSGFHTWGEVFRSMRTGEVIEHNVTLLSVAMREGEPKGRALGEAHVDDAILRGPAAQLRRLTSLVYTAMGELQKAHADLRRLNQRLTVMAETDWLTSLYNRGRTEGLITRTMADAAAQNKPVGLVMADVDHFKRVNDVFGHHAGDVVLKEFAHMLKEAALCQEGAFAGRWGGEEFFLVLPGADLARVTEVAERLRGDVERHVFASVGTVTVSLGVSSEPGTRDPDLLNSIYSRVDDALYRAKEGGRNRVVQAAAR